MGSIGGGGDGVEPPPHPASAKPITAAANAQRLNQAMGQAYTVTALPWTSGADGGRRGDDCPALAARLGFWQRAAVADFAYRPLMSKHAHLDDHINRLARKRENGRAFQSPSGFGLLDQQHQLLEG